MARCQCKTKQKPVSVRSYKRVRNGRKKHVNTHSQRLPHVGMRLASKPW